MIFPTLDFLLFFLIVFALVWLASPHHVARKAMLLGASYFFYGYWDWRFTFLLAASTIVNWGAGWLLEAEKNEIRRKWIAAFAIALNLLTLGFFKYYGFFIESLDGLLRSVGWERDLPFIEVVLPVGISFFVFQGISYVVDAYRRDLPRAYSLLDVAVYKSFFPQLVAGPIVRFREIADQLPQPRLHRWDDVAAGFPRFALGLCKKVIIADSLAPMVDACFATPADEMTFAIAWLGAITYTLQLYFDFSGYSDMAIGLGRMLGFRLPENFARPYSSVTITDFWRRWHMSLSRWFRDYVYIPLGGNRGGVVQTYRNLSIVFVLTGFWHGANWTFLVWGLFHGGLLVLERRFGWDSAPAATRTRIARRVLTMLLVVIGWVFFRSADLGTAFTIIGHMLLPDFGGLTDAVAAAATNQRIVLLVLALAIVAMPDHPVSGPYLESSRDKIATAARVSLMTVGVGYAAILVASGTFSPFLYYQF